MKEYGKEAADNANYGWGVDSEEESISIRTKVYGKGILTSEGYLTGKKGWEIEHDFEEFPNPDFLTDLWQRKWWFE